MNAYDLARLAMLGDPATEVLIRPIGALADALGAEGIGFAIVGAERLDDGRVALAIEVGHAGLPLGQSVPVLPHGRMTIAKTDGREIGGNPGHESSFPEEEAGLTGYLVDGDPVDIEQFLNENFPDPDDPARRNIKMLPKSGVFNLPGGQIVMKL